jgi:hypothetical protein
MNQLTMEKYLGPPSYILRFIGDTLSHFRQRSEHGQTHQISKVVASIHTCGDRNSVFNPFPWNTLGT